MCVGIDAGWRWNIQRGGQVGNYCIQHGLHAFIFQSGTTKDRHQCASNRCSTQSCNKLLFGNFLTFKIFEGKILIGLGHALNQILPVLRKLGLHARRHICMVRFRPKVIDKGDRLLFD